MLLSRNVHPKYVQELLGRASIALTLDPYSHTIEGMDGGTTDAIDGALGWVLRVPLMHRCRKETPEGARSLFHFSTICRKKESEPPRTRTWNLEIKSLLLCQLS